MKFSTSAIIATIAATAPTSAIAGLRGSAAVTTGRGLGSYGYGGYGGYKVEEPSVDAEGYLAATAEELALTAAPEEDGWGWDEPAVAAGAADFTEPPTTEAPEAGGWGWDAPAAADVVVDVTDAPTAAPTEAATEPSTTETPINDAGVEGAVIDVDWSFGVEQAPIELTSTQDVIVFQYPNGGHNVYQFPDKVSFDTCDFTNAVQVCGQDVTECVVDGPVIPSDTGIFWFGCELPSHCEFGAMKVAVILTL